ncbi:MAG: amidohydrolase [Acidobacteria bacterium]|nr:amidohydrolase [Acidobacteriota bacterium]MCA1619881.1 amidohydrolase [Acidobacteriota bacterium]
MRLRSKLLTTLLAAACPLAALLPRGSSAQPGYTHVSLVLTNGRVFTADARGTVAEAVAIRGNRIVAVGSTHHITSSYKGERTIDLKGRLVTPGFNDAHIHFLGGGLSLLRVNLVGAKTLAEAKARVAARVREVQPGAWVTGRGWDHTLWGGEWPTKKDLDEVAPNNPVILQRVDGHVSWANTLALQKGGVTRATEAPQGGEILHDAAGEPTGILKETAAGLVTRVVPAATREENTEALTRALAEARRYGITSVSANDVPSSAATPLYREMLKAGKLTVRVAEWQQFERTVEELKRERAEFESHKDDPLRLRLTALKGYVDGTLGSRTAAMLAPFADDPHNSGIPRRPPEELTRMIVERDAAGFQIALHCIGDRANRMALDGFAAALKANPRPTPVAKPAAAASNQNAGGPTSIMTTYDGSTLRKGEFTFGLHYSEYDRETRRNSNTRRHRVEHAQVVAPTDFARYRDLGVLASMQPSHAISDKRWAQERLGEYRVLGAYSWHTFAAHAVAVPFGTDWPVEPISPYLGLYAAVTRQSTEGEPSGGWWPEQRLSIEDAIRNYTAEPAYATFEEREKGRIVIGMLADLVVHSKDMLAIAPSEILNTQPDLTVFDGRVVYERKSDE